MGYIVAAIFGILLGNFATSVLYRAPKGELISNFLSDSNKANPFCSLCKHPLTFYEYLPIFSWLFVGRNCNYCKQPIDGRYTQVEIICLAISVFLYSTKGFSEAYIILLIACIVLTLYIYLREQASYTLLLLLVCLSAIYYSLLEQTMLPWALRVSSFCFLIMLFVRMKLINLQKFEYRALTKSGFLLVSWANFSFIIAVPAILAASQLASLYLKNKNYCLTMPPIALLIFLPFN